MKPGQRISPMPRRADSHPELLAARSETSRRPRPAMRFEHGQAFINEPPRSWRSGINLKSRGGIESRLSAKSASAMSYEKFLAYDVPMSDELRMEYDMQNISPKKLAHSNSGCRSRPTVWRPAISRGCMMRSARTRPTHSRLAQGNGGGH